MHTWKYLILQKSLKVSCENDQTKCQTEQFIQTQNIKERSPAPFAFLYLSIPTALLGDVTLWSPADYAAYFLPSALSSPDTEGNYPIFTAADYAKASGIRGRATYSMIHLLEKLGLVRECEEKVGRSRGYRVKTTGGLSD